MIRLRPLPLGLLALLLAMLFAASACLSGGSDDCGPNPCGACEDGFRNVEQCVDGEWECDCVPKQGTQASENHPSSENGDGGGDSASEPALSCAEKLANPTASGACSAEDEGQACEQGCLSCRCTDGEWGPCTTSQSCLVDAG